MKRKAFFVASSLTLCIVLGMTDGVSRGNQAASSDPYLAAGIQKLSGEQMPAAMFTLPSLVGPPLDPSTLRRTVLVVNFWATWCVPCKEEMPSLERLQRMFDAARVRVVAITAEHQEDGLQTFTKSLGLSFPILLDENREVSAAFGVRGLPTTVIIGADGRIHARAVGPRQWDDEAAVALVRSLLS